MINFKLKITSTFPAASVGRWRSACNLKLKIQNSKFKTSGSALLIGIMLSGLMLTVGVTAARLAVREVQFSADLFLAEKAYFNAESGVERALFTLKNDPLAHIQPTNTPPGDAHTTVSVRNLITPTATTFTPDTFAFELAPLSSQKWRFRHDADPSTPTTQTPVSGPVAVNLDTPGDWFWRFLCQDASGRTQALQAQELAQGSVADLTARNGRTDDGTLTNFNAWSSVDKNTCHLSLQNTTVGDSDCQATPNACRTFTFSGTTMAPHAAHIHAVGRQENREKHIRFDYAQNTLGNLFDFSFLHSGGGF